MYGDIAIDLLRELKRSATHLIPPYNADKMRMVMEEIKSLYNEVKNTLEDFDQRKQDLPVAGSMEIQYQGILRNKRCLLAYLNERTLRLQELRWDVGAILPVHIKENLSLHEIDYFTEYSKGLNTYMQSVGLDLCSDSLPPKDLYIEVRVLEDLGEIATEEGFITLEKDSQHFLRRSDVEALIKQGSLQHVA
eukprot:m.174832 g.174832  ORF g.174832 m.174832 type:complete len:192 (-) comp31786_c1_seq3:437-1012(-)